MNAGYSHKSLKDKLGLKSEMTAYFQNCPLTIKSLLTHPITDFNEIMVLGNPVDFILCFSVKATELSKLFPSLKTHLKPQGILWIAWPKQASRYPTDLTENIIRRIGLNTGLVDVKVIAINETWSGLKFVFRLKDR